MDISTTSSASTGMSSDMTQASVVSKNSSAKNTSFKSEMNKVSEKNNSQTEEKIDTEKKSETKIEGKTAEKENTQNKSTEVKNNNEFESASNFDLEENPILAGEIQYNNLDILNNQMRTLIDANMMLTDAVSDARTPVKVDYSVIKMDMNDAQFFTDLVQDTDKTLQNVALDLSANVESQVKEIQKNVKVSSVLMNALSDAVKNNILEYSDTAYFQVFSVHGMPGTLNFNCPRIVLANDENPIDPFVYSRALIQGRKRILRLFNFCRKFFPGFEFAYISHISDMLGIRESYRIKGKYTLTKNDIIQGLKPRNIAFASNYPIDIHSNSKNNDKLIFSGNTYYVPLETLISEDYENLYAAGRIISSTFEAQAAVRTQVNCFSMGEAVAKDIYKKLNS